MATDTAIEWADDTANFWEGCTQVGPGCDICYAMERAKRYGSVEWNGPPRFVKAGAAQLRKSNTIALAERRRRLVFINSLSDTFDKNANPEWRRALFDAIKAVPHITALILTKRIGNAIPMSINAGGFPSNAVLGATFCNQEEIDRDAAKLRAAGALLHVPIFASVEPLLGPAVFDFQTLAKLDGVIVGGESGREARPMHPAWARDLRDQCAVNRVPFHFKQWGEWKPRLERTDANPGSLRRIQTMPSNANTERFIDLQGRDVRALPVVEWEYQGGPNAAGVCSFWRAGKKGSGRLLDGVTHDEFLRVPREIADAA